MLVLGGGSLESGRSVPVRGLLILPAGDLVNLCGEGNGEDLLCLFRVRDWWYITSTFSSTLS